MEFLQRRRNTPLDAFLEPLSVYPISWFGLLFGMLACGAQLASIEGQLDTTKAWVFGKPLV